ncbi:MAG: 50S ribosomal protein L5 [Candidatus Omnitrophica bacterium]|nr:50S ribosomal protein L5 [Candidatus Omnitrophota bacterium]
MIPRLLEKYRKEIVPLLMRDLGYKNKLNAPRLEKVVINMGVGEGAHDIKVLEEAMHSLGLISGQKPIITRARKSISNFKIKKGDPVGCKVTLRKYKMYEFLDRFINVALPRIRDFRGVSPDAFDEHGNYNIGLTEYTVFPEIEYDKIQHVLGMDITIAIKAKNKKESFVLLKLLGMPFKEAE